MKTSAFSVVRKASLSDAVYRQLSGKILSGELPAGESLPAERELSEALGVNRGAVREAIKRLQQAGLVDVRQGGVSRVLDYRNEGGLELLPSLLVDGSGRLDATVVRSIMAMRSALAPEIAAAAAQRGNDTFADELDALVVMQMRQQHDPAALQADALAFWQKLVAHGGNIAFRLAFNSMTRTYAQVATVLRSVLAPEFRDHQNFAAIAAAVRARDQNAAREAARRHLEIGRAAMDAVLAAMPADRSTP